MNKNKTVKLLIFSGIWSVVVLLFSGGDAHAAGLISSLFGGSAITNFTSIFESIVASFTDTPGLVSAIAYLMALMFGANGVVKLSDHVNDPTRTKINEVVSLFAGGGALLALPITYEAMRNTIGGVGEFGDGFNTVFAISGIIGTITSFIPAQDFNQILSNIIESVEGFPALIAGFAYLSAIILGYLGIIDLKQHVDDPKSKPLKEGIIRLTLGGALFSIPTIYAAMASTISGDGRGFFDVLGDILGIGTLFFSTQAREVACASSSIGFLGILGNTSLGGVICNTMIHSAAFPNFLNAFAYLAGLVFGIWGLFKLKDHVIDPNKTPAWDGIVRLIAGGGMLALPVVIDAAKNTVGFGVVPHSTTGFNDGGVRGGFFGDILNSILGLFGGGSGSGGASGGLDVMLSNFMTDIFGPMTILMNWFTLVAGTIFIIIGISRLLKSSQDGAKGPGGFGTIMTFIIGGALLSFSPLVSVMSMSLFNNPQSLTFASLSYGNTGGAAGATGAALLQGNALANTLSVINAIVKFMIILGLVSFARGLFIFRDVAEGGQQASIMAGTTHLLGGALAVNIGPVLNAVQTTLGVQGFGLTFS